jgi:hypothetical protein
MKAIPFLAMLLFTVNTAIGQDTVSVYINSKLLATTTSNPIHTITLKKVKATVLKQVSFKVTGGSMSNAMYKKTLSLLDGDNIIAVLTPTQPGYFETTDKNFIKKLIAHKKISIALQLNPANDKMMMPSKQVQLCYINML